MTRQRLALCIPTYNFGAFIGTTLDSIVPRLARKARTTNLQGRAPAWLGAGEKVIG